MIEQINIAFTSLKVATDIAKGLVSVDKALEQATLKMQVAELMTTLAETKISIADVQKAVDDRDTEIKRLEDALANKSKVIRHGGAYYELNDAGAASGAPYCSRCFEVDHKLVHLALAARFMDPSKCPQCDAIFDGHTTTTIR